ncbi:MAG: anthranilate synthase component I family protein, partial [Flavobacteriales bacterium]
LHWNGVDILCASPERFLRREGNRLISQPIKGTAPRHPDPVRDAAIAERLRNDPKERAENVMITDLVRNDLSQVACPASVEVEELCGIHSFRNVHQMISTVTCTVRGDRGFADILRAAFPMGSMTGAPKIRAMEITAEVEPVRRGLYSGAIGWADPDGQGSVGDFDLNVVIRTALADRESGRWSVHVGGAITALAEASAEWEETRLKARAVLDALGAREMEDTPESATLSADGR